MSSVCKIVVFLCLIFFLPVLSGVSEGMDAADNQEIAEDGASFFGDENPFSRQPIYLGMPYNRLILTSHYDSARFDIMPLDDSVSRSNSGDLSVRFVNNPHKEFQVKWNFVERIDSFQELVLEEYRQRFEYLVDKVRKGTPEDDDWIRFSEYFESLFDYLRFLEDYKKELSGFSDDSQKFLFEEAVYRIKGGDYLTGLARFDALFQANRNYPGLDRAAAGALNLALSQLEEAGEYAQCRKRLESFAPYLSQNPVFQDWVNKLNERANNFFERSKESESSKDYFHAHQSIDEAIKINPDSSEFLAWKNNLQKNFPRFCIGVDIPLSLEEDFMSLPHWARQRGRRPLRQMLCEFDRPDLAGSVYSSSFGTVEKPVDNNRSMELVLNADLTDNRKRPGFHDIIETLRVYRSVCQTTSTSFSFSLLDLGSTEEKFPRLLLQLDRPFPLPESLFAIPLLASRRFDSDSTGSDSKTQSYSEDKYDYDTKISPGSTFSAPIAWKTGRYDYLPQHEGLDALIALPQKGAGNREPAVLLEKTVLRSGEAVEQLLAGRIDVIDRLAPWEMERLKKTSQVTVGRYLIPTVHFIVPNRQKPLTASRTFRRALIYGLNRNGMLARLLEKGGEGIVSSVPFVRGRSIGDPLGYACDPSIRPRPYEPKLAIALVMSAFNQIRNREPGWDEQTSIPELILARPEHERAEYVALLIRRQWAAIGVPVRIIVYKDEQTIGRDEQVDFWLVERNVREPLVDASRIFSCDGLCGKASPYMELALEKLHQSEDWPTAAARLQEIHRLCYDEVSILPLWQLVEYYAHRSELSGISSEHGIVDLYQHLPSWRDQPTP